MALAVEAPAREDLSFQTNDDKRVGARWLKSDAVTGVDIDTAVMTLVFDGPEPSETPYVEHPIVLPPDVQRIDSTTPGDPAGWIDPDQLADGVVVVTVAHGIWASHATRTGSWDLVAVGEGLQRCLVRGKFVAEEGVS